MDCALAARGGFRQCLRVRIFLGARMDSLCLVGRRDDRIADRPDRESTALRWSSALPVYPHRFFIVDKNFTPLVAKSLAR